MGFLFIRGRYFFSIMLAALLTVKLKLQHRRFQDIRMHCYICKSEEFEINLIF